MARVVGLEQQKLERLARELVLQNAHFAPGEVVPDDANEQTKLLALTGRRP